MDNKNIVDLVAKMQQGDQNSFSALYDEFASRIYKYIRIKVGSSEETEDIMQEVFSKAWQGSKSLKLLDLNFSAWLYRIANNTVNDHYRKSYRRPQTISLDPKIDIAGSDDSSDSIQNYFDKAEIQVSLGGLSQQYKQVIELRFFQDFTIEETAKIMNKTSVGIRVLQYRALRKLESIYKKYERQAKTIL